MTFLTKFSSAIGIASLACASAPPAFAAKPVLKKSAKQVAQSLSCKKLTASGLGYTILKSAKGVAPGPDDKVTIGYRGVLAKDGAEFDANAKARFPVSGVIAGFAEGLRLMPVGSRMRLCIPAKLGYKERALDGIPANSDLVFEVTMLGITPAPPAALTTATDRSCAQKTATGLGYSALDAGDGIKPTDDYFVYVGYAGYLAQSGAKFDESPGAAFGVTEVVPGFSEGLKLMQKNARYRLCIPAALGYGAAGTGPIPPNSDLVFLVELIDLRSKAEVKALEEADAKKAAQ